jgi:hypothetical protein
MSAIAPLPRAARPFIDFAALLRAHGFPVAPEQTTAFLTAIELLGPKSIGDVRRAAHATFAPPHERGHEFDALFDSFFVGRMVAAPAAVRDDEDEVRVQEEDGGQFEPLVSDEESRSGEAASFTEVLQARRFPAAAPSEALRRLAREAPARLPRRRSARRVGSPLGRHFDLRRSLREAMRTGGEMITLPRLARKTRQRPLLVLIDVSGSMKERSHAHLRFAHALARAADRVEVFTLGTRLTRVTPALRLRSASQALERAAEIVSDWDGGTRIGDALQALLAVPRFSGFARGAVVLVLSDGLERGDPAAMTDAVQRLARLAWRICWLNPLAADPAYAPRTAAMSAVLPFVGDIADGSTTARLCDAVLGLRQGRAA